MRSQRLGTPVINDSGPQWAWHKPCQDGLLGTHWCDPKRASHDVSKLLWPWNSFSQISLHRLMERQHAGEFVWSSGPSSWGPGTTPGSLCLGNQVPTLNPESELLLASKQGQERWLLLGCLQTLGTCILEAAGPLEERCWGGASEESLATGSAAVASPIPEDHHTPPDPTPVIPGFRNWPIRGFTLTLSLTSWVNLGDLGPLWLRFLIYKMG